jgi:hypothetical protein
MVLSSQGRRTWASQDRKEVMDWSDRGGAQAEGLRSRDPVMTGFRLDSTFVKEQIDE